METKTKRVFKSDYLCSRHHNHKLYAKLIENIEIKCQKYLNLYSEMTITLSMSARYQSPTIIITNNEEIPRQIDAIQELIEECIDSVGFSYMDCQNEDTYFVINFED